MLDGCFYGGSSVCSVFLQHGWKQRHESLTSHFQTVRRVKKKSARTRTSDFLNISKNSTDFLQWTDGPYFPLTYGEVPQRTRPIIDYKIINNYFQTSTRQKMAEKEGRTEKRQVKPGDNLGAKAVAGAPVAGGGVVVEVREKKGSLRAAIPTMPFPLAVICLFLNTFIPGLGKSVIKLGPLVYVCGKTVQIKWERD